MIQVDALAMLFYLEFTAICLVLLVIFYYKNRKHRRLYQIVIQEVLHLKAASPAGGSGVNKPSEAQDSKAAAPDTSAVAAHAQLQKEKDQLVATVAELEKKLEAENKHLDALKKKYATLETEYSILYDKSFASDKK